MELSQDFESLYLLYHRSGYLGKVPFVCPAVSGKPVYKTKKVSIPFMDAGF